MIPVGVRVIGFGSDLCNIERIQGSLDRFGERFIRRCFTELEAARAERRPLTRAGTYAKRFAAKEAMSKALGTGFRDGVFMRDIGVVNAAARLADITPVGHKAAVHLTLTDDHPFALAVVLITAEPE
jgi:holo-[acyl-carrier protein] synthase